MAVILEWEIMVELLLVLYAATVIIFGLVQLMHHSLLVDLVVFLAWLIVGCVVVAGWFPMELVDKVQ
tara:strand:+ start:726 stop:926 length:201 start_codon:yes stop_codon:yes gene_type:complete